MLIDSKAEPSPSIDYSIPVALLIVAILWASVWILIFYTLAINSK